MIKKITSVLLAAAMSASLVACGGSGDAAKEGTGSEASAQETAGIQETAGTQETSGASEAAGDNTLTVWAWDPAFNIYAIKEAEALYQKENPDFKLDVVEVAWNDLQPKLSTVLSSGDLSQLPDLMLMQDFAYKKYVMTYDNLFEDITDSGIDFSQFSAGKTANSMVDNRNYGIPFDNGAEIAVYRVDILEQAGYTIEDLTDIDWDRFIEIGKDVLDKTGYSLVSSQAGSSDIIMQMVQSAGGKIWKEDGSPYFTGNPVLEKALEVYKELFTTGVMATGNGWDEYIATFTSGKTCGVINGCWIMASIESAKDQSGLWRVTNMPSLPGIDGATNYSNQGGSSWGITTNCKNVELAVDFMNKTFAGSSEFYDTILLGAGALSTWIPASESTAYGEPQEFYGGEAVFEKITEFASKTPAFNVGIYFTEANDALAVAATNVSSGADIAGELATAEETVSFNMGN